VDVGGEKISAILAAPSSPTALYVMAHGAGAGMRHRFMAEMSNALVERRIATFRYNFPYMEKQKGSPDQKPKLLRTVRAAVEVAQAALPDLPIFAGGKSMGGRMSSEAQAAEPITGLRGLVFVGFPLHPPGSPGVERAEHLDKVNVPMLFLQGTRDDLADLNLITGVTSKLGSLATLHVEDGADHSFHMLKRSGRTDAEVMAALADRIQSWVARA
jgi:predicted alpha/beta-hydrolase family hydrolase